MFSWLGPQRGQPKSHLRDRLFLRLRAFFRGLKPVERFLLVGLLAGFLAGVIYNGTVEYFKITATVAAPGGQYVEGVVGNRLQLDELITRLTSVGLVSVTADRKVTPVLATAWSISADGKTYTFHLVDGVASGDLAAVLKEEEMFKTVEVTTPDSATLVTKLKQPFGPLLWLLGLPLFPIGPYSVETDSPQEVVFVPNDNFPLGRPFLDHITIQTFPDGESLVKAVKSNKLTGIVSTQLQPRWITHQATLPRTISAIFNTDKTPIKDAQVRRDLLVGQSFPAKLQLVMVTTPALRGYADNLINTWSGQNVEVSLRLIEDASLRSTVIPARDYDVLIYGVDEGIEPDPYRFWHSSQATAAGLNLSQIKNRELDILLEEARKTVADDKRFEKYGEIEAKLEELAVRKILDKLTVTYQMSGTIRGVEEPLIVTPASRYNLVWKWYTKERRVRKTEDGGQKTD